MKIIKKLINSLGFKSSLKAFLIDINYLLIRLTFPFRFLIFKSSSCSKLDKLHLGCGSRYVPGWINIDSKKSDLRLNLSSGTLPFPSHSISGVVMQHVLEHLYIDSEAIPLLSDIYRVLSPSSILFLSVPDLQKLCYSYINDSGSVLRNDKLTRWPYQSPLSEFLPSQHIINEIFYQNGSHRYMYGFTIVSCILSHIGFSHISISTESDFLACFPEFPARNDDIQTLYVKAVK